MKISNNINLLILMLIPIVFTFNSYAKTDSGIYGVVSLNKEDAKRITNHLKQIGMDDYIDKDKLHVTILFSKTTPKHLKVDPFKIYHGVVIGEPEIIGRPPYKALIVDIQSDELNERHNQLIIQGGTHDYPTYKIHLSLKYNATEKDLELLKSSPLPITNLSFSNEEFKTIESLRSKEKK